jgi:hypothetical protein
MCKPQRPGAVEPHTTAERRHQLRIEPAPMREFCAYNKNCLRPWLAAPDNGGTARFSNIEAGSLTVMEP